MSNAPTPDSPPPPSAPPPGAAPAMPQVQLTGNGRRFGAALLEVLLVIVTLGIGWMIWWIIDWGKATTPAKQLMGIRIIKADTYQPAGFGDMAMRELVGKTILSNITFGISTIVGAIMILVNDNHQALWDKIATTLVIDDPSGAYIPK